jgi:hypothetical protein
VLSIRKSENGRIGSGEMDWFAARDYSIRPKISLYARPLLPLFPQGKPPTHATVRVNDLLRHTGNQLVRLSVLKSVLRTVPTSQNRAHSPFADEFLKWFKETNYDSDDSDPDFDEEEQDGLESYIQVLERSEEFREFCRREQVDDCSLRQSGLMKSRHSLESALRHHEVDEPDIPVDDALSFVSNMICRTSQGMRSHSSSSSISSSGESTPETPHSFSLNTRASLPIQPR